MNKPELITVISEASGKTKKETEEFIDIFVETVINTVAKGEKVQLIGFGTFDVTECKERIGRNPQTGEPMKILGRKKPKFTVGKSFKDRVNE